MKNYKRIKGSKIEHEIKKIVDLHEAMSGCYFWKPPSIASARRSYENHRSNDLEFIYRGQNYDISQQTECSCKNIYYKLIVTVDGSRKNVSALKKLIA